MAASKLQECASDEKNLCDIWTVTVPVIKFVARKRLVETVPDCGH
jgi:hypothetical protein